MKTNWIRKTALIAIAVLMSCMNTLMATEKCECEIEEEISMIKSFYEKYIANEENSLDSTPNEELKKECFTSEWLNVSTAMAERLDYDLVISAQDVSEEMRKTLSVKLIDCSEENISKGWYLVSYSSNGWGITNIPVKVVNKDGKVKISCIMPAYKEKAKSQAKQREDGVYTIVDEKAEYLGGEVALKKFVNMQFKKPKNCKPGNIIVGCVVSKDGSIRDANIKRGLSAEADKEALRVVYMMPKWKPAKVGGKNVDMSCVIPFTIK